MEQWVVCFKWQQQLESYSSFFFLVCVCATMYIFLYIVNTHIVHIRSYTHIPIMCAHGSLPWVWLPRKSADRTFHPDSDPSTVKKKDEKNQGKWQTPCELLDCGRFFQFHLDTSFFWSDPPGGRVAERISGVLESHERPGGLEEGVGFLQFRPTSLCIAFKRL